MCVWLRLFGAGVGGSDDAAQVIVYGTHNFATLLQVLRAVSTISPLHTVLNAASCRTPVVYSVVFFAVNHALCCAVQHTVSCFQTRSNRDG